MKFFLSAFIIATICGAHEVNTEIPTNDGRSLEHVINHADITGLDFVLSAVANEVFGQLFTPAIYLSDTFWRTTKKILHDLLSCKPNNFRINGFYKVVRQVIEDYHHRGPPLDNAVFVTDFVHALRRELESVSPIDLVALEALGNDLIHIAINFPIISINSYLEYLARLLMTFEYVIGANDHDDFDKPLSLAFSTDFKFVPSILPFQINTRDIHHNTVPYPNIWKFNKYGWTEFLDPFNVNPLKKLTNVLFHGHGHDDHSHHKIPELPPRNITPEKLWEHNVLVHDDSNTPQIIPNAASGVPIVVSATSIPQVHFVDGHGHPTHHHDDHGHHGHYGHHGHHGDAVHFESAAEETNPTEQKTTTVNPNEEQSEVKRNSEGIEPYHSSRHEVTLDNVVSELFGGLGNIFDSAPRLPGFDAIPKLPKFDAFPRFPGFDALSKIPGFDALSKIPGFDALSKIPGFDRANQLSEPEQDTSSIFSAPKATPNPVAWQSVLDPRIVGSNLPNAMSAARSALIDSINSANLTSERDYVDEDFSARRIVVTPDFIKRKHIGYMLLKALEQYKPADVTDDHLYRMVTSKIVQAPYSRMDPVAFVDAFCNHLRVANKEAVKAQLTRDIHRIINHDVSIFPAAVDSLIMNIAQV